MKLILASASPARADLLRDAAVRFEVRPSRAREIARGPLAERVARNADLKAHPVSRLHPGRWVLAADTMIGFEGRVYGKPPSRKAAIELLFKLSGRTHVLATGVVLTNGERTIRTVARTRVRIRKLDRAAIRAILAKQDPTSVAGGYCIEKKNDPLIERITGSYSNVIGLPMEWVLACLRKLGLA